MANDTIIEVSNVWKRYGLPPLLPWAKPPADDSGWALRDISFSVPRGGSLGILGRNGAGKSTLLKVLAGVTPPDKGSVSVRGVIFPMIELVAGMSMELTGRENIHVLGTIMGLSPQEIRAITPQVEEFSELEEWLVKPVWQYSSGMVGRLAFGIAVNIRADILLVDEVLSTGDIMFQKKCQLKVQEMLASGTTLIFVTHSPYQMERLCEKAILMEKGMSVMYGDSSIVMQEYLARTHKVQRSNLEKADLNSFARPGTGDVRITNVALDKPQAKYGESLDIVLKYIAVESIKNMHVLITLRNDIGSVITTFHLKYGDNLLAIKKGYGQITCRIPSFTAMGDMLTLDVRLATTGYDLDRVQEALWFSVETSVDILSRVGHSSVTYMEHNFTHVSGAEDDG